MLRSWLLVDLILRDIYTFLKLNIIVNPSLSHMPSDKHTITLMFFYC